MVDPVDGDRHESGVEDLDVVALLQVPDRKVEVLAGDAEEIVQDTAEALQLKLGKVAQPIRVAVSGGPVSPPIDVTLELLGRQRTIERLNRAIGYVEAFQLTIDLGLEVVWALNQTPCIVAVRPGDRVVEVRESKMLRDSPCRLVSPDDAPMRDMAR